MPRRRRSIVEDLALRPWWISAALSLVLIVVGLLANRGSPLKLFAYALSMICASTATLSLGRMWRQDRLLANQKSIASLAALSWREF
jgi:hypothetical protein